MSRSTTRSILSLYRLSNRLIEVEYHDGTKEQISVIPINTRIEAIELCIAYTKDALKREDAFERLHSFKKDFTNARNYEIEDYLESITGTLVYRIVELCPFNRFSFFK